MSDEINYVLPHDSSNALILPPTVKKSIETKKTKQKPSLSKKKQKKLQKILDRKKKRFTRIEVFEKLGKNQISQEELNLFTPVALMQQKCLKRKFVETELSKNIASSNSLSGSGKKKYHQSIDLIHSKTSSGPYFETDSSSSDDSDHEPEHQLEIRDDLKASTSIDEKVPEYQHSENILDELEDIKIAPDIALKMKNESTSTKRRPTVHVPVFRTPEAQENRLNLPILAMEQEIMEQINDSQIVIVCGETGSGKTTQIPQFLYEAGYCSDAKMIGVTEPRRVAAMAMSRRVADEMNLPEGVISYQIRYEGNVGDRTKIKFMTDGVLLKELRGDFLLTNYSAIIIDEAHERSMYSDILIGLLSRVVVLREKRNILPLKLIIMSATLRIDDFLSDRLFKRRPAVVDVDARQFPVTVFFNRRTEENYLAEAYKKCCKIHRKLPDGAILVFVSGQREVHTLVSWLSKTFPANVDRIDVSDDESSSRRRRKRTKIRSEPVKIDLDSYKIDEFDVNDTDAADFELLDDDDDDDNRLADSFLDRTNDSPMFCLPLYSLLSAKKQSQVFEPPPVGWRLCVVATNVAETSLTIPNVKYVVDTGKEKARAYDGVTGVSKFVVQWISKASADQRTGRAGRTCPGKCYRLYSSAIFSDFQQFSQPEIVNKPVDDVVLLMKNMNILKVANFPFPTSPDVDVLLAAERRLIKLGALQREKSEDLAKITPLGRTMALFPVSPSYAKILSLGHQENLLPYVICLVSALSVREPLVNLTSLSIDDDEKSNENISKHLKIRAEWAGKGEFFMLGDLQVLLRAVLEWHRNGCSTKFCDENGLRPKAMIEIRKMRRQLTNIIAGVYPNEKIFDSEAPLPTPTAQQSVMLRQIFLAGLADNVARKRLDSQVGGDKNVKNSYECSSKIKDLIFIHPTSTLRRRLPDFVVFNEIVDSSKKFMFNVMAVDPEWLPTIAEAHCSFGALMKDVEPWYDPSEDAVFCRCSCSFGDASWCLGPVNRKHPLDLDYYRRFAASFLDGSVMPKVEKWRKFLLSSPSTMLRSWANLHKRTEDLLNALVTKKIFSRQRLNEVWTNEDKFYLCKEFCEWVPESIRDRIRIDWPPSID